MIDGKAHIIARREKVRCPRVTLPDMHLHVPGAQYARPMAATRSLAPVTTAVVHPCDPLSLTGVLDAAGLGMILPGLVGPRHRIEGATKDAGRSLEGLKIMAIHHSHAAAVAAVALVRAGRVAALMKGSLHTDELMEAVVNIVPGRQTDRQMSHVYVLDVPTYPKPPLITDVAVNIHPDAATKRDIVQSAIDLALALGTDLPKVAIPSVAETVNPRIASTLDAVALCKMADRCQITGGLLDGRLAFDNAISAAAAAAKGITSDVAGVVDILVAPVPNGRWQTPHDACAVRTLMGKHQLTRRWAGGQARERPPGD